MCHARHDSNPGTTAQPFRTITRAYGLAAPGVTIHVLPGVLPTIPRAGGCTSAPAGPPPVHRAPIEVIGGAVIDGQNASDRNEGIYLDGSYNIVDGFEIRGGPTAASASGAMATRSSQ